MLLALAEWQNKKEEQYDQHPNQTTRNPTLGRSR